MASIRSTSAWRVSILAQLGLLSACTGHVKESEQPDPGGGDDPGEVVPVTSEGGAPTGRSRYENETTEFRTSAPTCENAPVDDQAVIDDPNIGGACKSGADCTDQEHGYCAIVGGQIYQTECRYGCETDEDCGADNLCECGPNVGTCIPASCRSSADCGGARCLRVVEQDACSDGFGPRTFYKCESAQDGCIGDDDCKTPEVCLSNQDGTRSCRERQLCGIGRPFLVESEVRQAHAIARGDWSEDLGRQLGRLALGLDSSQRAELSAGWLEIALMEHASIAAFARFQLQLLSLGAPADLVEATNQALVDETRHARLAFGVSSVFSGERRGPGVLSIERALSHADLEEIAMLVLLEGCVGETCAAMEAEWAVGQCRDDTLRDLLAAISRDERSHSELAWRFIAWATRQRPDLGEALLSQALAEAEEHRRSATPEVVASQWKNRYGLVPEVQRLALRTVVLEEIVIPCLAALRRDTAA